MIQEGDYVRHRNPLINGGLQMCVQDIDEQGLTVKCPHFVGAEAIHKDEWFAISDLTLVNKGDGGFK